MESHRRNQMRFCMLLAREVKFMRMLVLTNITHFLGIFYCQHQKCVFSSKMSLLIRELSIGIVC